MCARFNVDDPVGRIDDYIEDVLPFSPTIGDIVKAIQYRGFSISEFQGAPKPRPWWVRPITGGRLFIKEEPLFYAVEYWPSSRMVEYWNHEALYHSGVVRRCGDIRYVLRETDRFIRVFTIPCQSVLVGHDSIDPSLDRRLPDTVRLDGHPQEP